MIKNKDSAQQSQNEMSKGLSFVLTPHTARCEICGYSRQSREHKATKGRCSKELQMQIQKAKTNK